METIVSTKRVRHCGDWSQATPNKLKFREIVDKMFDAIYGVGECGPKRTSKEPHRVVIYGTTMLLTNDEVAWLLNEVESNEELKSNIKF